jgi:hypothetical protein
MTGTFTAGFLVLGFISGIAGLSAMIVQRSIRLINLKSASKI